jgi:hypothetical protein
VHNKIPGKPAIYRPFWDFSLLDVSKTGLYDNEISFAILHSEVSVNIPWQRGSRRENNNVSVFESLNNTK